MNAKRIYHYFSGFRYKMETDQSFGMHGQEYQIILLVKYKAHLPLTWKGVIFLEIQPTLDRFSLSVILYREKNGNICTYDLFRYNTYYKSVPFCKTFHTGQCGERKLHKYKPILKTVFIKKTIAIQSITINNFIVIIINQNETGIF